MERGPHLLALAATAQLLVSGGDERILPDPASGRTRYGCGAVPEPELLAFGSSTASVISGPAFAAAAALRESCVEQLRTQAPGRVYAAAMARQRAALLDYCGLDGDADALLAASGTDIHLLVAQLFRPHHSVMLDPSETGSGVPAALAGRHFSAHTAYGGAVAAGTALNDWHGAAFTLSPRREDGSLRDPAEVDADCAAFVDAACGAGESVLLVLTDVSKTGLIVPSVAAALALQRRWPQQLRVLVDACQFRLAPASVRAYLAHGMMVALTGSKFVSGPTFCGALLAPRGALARGAALPAGLQAYCAAGDWPAGSLADGSLPAASNFGLLLRWEGALTELRRFRAAQAGAGDFLREFGQAVRASLAGDAWLEALPVAPLERSALGVGPGWDLEQSIFPFLMYRPDAAGVRRPLGRDATRALYLRLQDGEGGRRYQFGQPVNCGLRDGVPVSALRLCASARMIADAGIDGGRRAAIIGDACAALARIRQLLGAP